MSSSSNRPIFRKPSLIPADNRDEELFPHGLAAALLDRKALLQSNQSQIASYHDYIATSRSQKKHHPLLRGSEAASHRKRSKDTYTGDIPMTRLEMKLLSGTSMLELDALSIIDFKVEDMVDAVTQPDWVNINAGGKRVRWLPDVLIDRRLNRPAFVEVKPISGVHPRIPKPGMSRAQLDRIARGNERVRKNRLRINGMREFAVTHGAEFWLLTEHQIRLQPQLFNAETMWIGLTSFIDDAPVDKAMVALRGLPPILRVADLTEVVPELAGSEVNLACILDRKGLIRLDRSDFFAMTCRFQNHLSKWVAG